MHDESTQPISDSPEETDSRRAQESSPIRIINDDRIPYPETIVIDANTIMSATVTPGSRVKRPLTTEDELYSLATYRSVLRDESRLSDTALDTLLILPDRGD